MRMRFSMMFLKQTTASSHVPVLLGGVRQASVVIFESGRVQRRPVLLQYIMNPWLITLHTDCCPIAQAAGCSVTAQNHWRRINRCFHQGSWRKAQAALWVHCDWAWCRILSCFLCLRAVTHGVVFWGLSICMSCLKFFKFCVHLDLRMNWLDVAGLMSRIKVAVNSRDSHSHEHDTSGTLKFEIKSTRTRGWTD